VNDPYERSEELVNRILGLSKRRIGIQLPVGFVRSRSTTVPPPLIVMIRGGRGGEVRLKLYCCLTLLAVDAPYSITRQISARTWAEMLALPKPDTNGARRVSDSLNWLADNHMVKLERRPSYPPKIAMLNPLGDGSPYSRPGSPYVTLPLGFWEQQWITRLSGTAIALLLILLDLVGGKARSPKQSVTPNQRLQYGLSPDSWTRATRELVDFGLINVDRVVRSRDLESVRARNFYSVNKERLNETVDVETHLKSQSGFRQTTGS
jgi:hypothetical protein